MKASYNLTSKQENPQADICIHIFPRLPEVDLRRLMLNSRYFHVFSASEFMPNTIPEGTYLSSASTSIIHSGLWQSKDSLLRLCANKSAQIKASSCDILGVTITTYWLYQAHLMMQAIAAEVTKTIHLGFKEICVHGDFAKVGNRFYNGLDKYYVLQILRGALGELQVLEVLDLQSDRTSLINPTFGFTRYIPAKLYICLQRMGNKSRCLADIYVGPGIRAGERSGISNQVYLYDPSLTSELEAGMSRIQERTSGLFRSAMQRYGCSGRVSHAAVSSFSADDKEAGVLSLALTAAEIYHKKKQRLLAVARRTIDKNKLVSNVFLSDQMNIDSMALVGALQYHLGLDTPRIEILRHSTARQEPLSLYAIELFANIFKPSMKATRISTRSGVGSITLSTTACSSLAGKFSERDIVFVLLTYAPFKTHNCKYDINIFLNAFNMLSQGIKQISGARLELKRKPGKEPLLHALDIHPDFTAAYLKDQEVSTSRGDQSPSAKVHIALCHFGNAHLSQILEGNVVVSIGCDEAQYPPEVCYVDFTDYIRYCNAGEIGPRVELIAKIFAGISDRLPVHIVSMAREYMGRSVVDSA